MTSTDYTIFMPIKPTAIYSNQVKSSKSSYINHCCLSFNSVSKTLLCSFTDISILIPSWFRGKTNISPVPHFSLQLNLTLAKNNTKNRRPCRLSIPNLLPQKLCLFCQILFFVFLRISSLFFFAIILNFFLLILNMQMKTIYFFPSFISYTWLCNENKNNSTS